MKCNMKNKRGVALIIVLCAFALILALGTAALVAANATYNTSAQTAMERQAYLTATSFAQVLRYEISENTSGALYNQVKAIPDGASWELSGDAGDIGTASGTLLRTGTTLNVTVTGTYQDKNSTVTMKLQLVNGRWTFDTFLPTPQGE